MTTLTTKLSYGHHALDGVMMDGQIWLRGRQIDVPLGFSHPKHVRRLFNRHQDEFTDQEARLIAQSTASGVQETLLFSLRGCELLAMLARTPEGKKFRRWVLDVLEGRRQRRAVQGELALPGTHRLPMEATRALEQAQALIELEHPAYAAIGQMIAGKMPLADDPGLDRLVEQYEGAHKLQAEAQRYFSMIRQEAVRMGYTLEAVKRARRVRHGAV